MVMAIKDKLKQFADQGIHFYLDDDKLKSRAPKGAMTQDIKAYVGQNKEAIISFLMDNRQDSLNPCLRSERAQVPMSFSQERLWFIDQLEEGSVHYHIPLLFEYQGTLDTEAVELSIQRLVDRHQSLRTVYGQNESGGYQRVLREVKLELKEENLMQCESPVAEQALIKELVSQPFDLTADLMIRVHHIVIRPDQGLLLFVLHHIACDGWSVSILANEFVTLYNGVVKGEATQLPPLALSYQDYACWQRNDSNAPSRFDAEKYWSDALFGAPPLHNLPLDKARPAVQQFTGGRCQVLLEPGVTEDISKLAQVNNVTVFMVMHAAFSLLLARYANEQDIVIGTPVANRIHPGLANVVGYFANTVVLRTKLDMELTFERYLRHVKDVNLGAQSHQDMPFESLLDMLQPIRSLSYSPIFQVMFSLDNYSDELPELSGCHLKTRDLSDLPVKFDLALSVNTRSDGSMMLEFEYNGHLFESDSIERMAANFRTLLNSIVASPLQPLYSYSLISEPEAHHIETQLTALEPFPPECTLVELFVRQAAATPDLIAIDCAGEQLTYAQLDTYSNQLANRLLRETHIQPDTLIGLSLPRSCNLLVGIIAILKSGGAYVPLDPEYPQERLAYMIEDAKITCIVGDQIQPQWLGAHIKWLDINIVASQNNSDTNLPAVSLKPSDLAYVMYTSGSTGRPKGVMVEHRHISLKLTSVATTFEFEPHDIFANIASYAFDISLVELLLPVLRGGTTRLLSGFSLEAYDQLIEQTRGVTHFHAVPAIMEMWLSRVIELRQQDPRLYQQIKSLFVGGDAVPRDLVKRLNEAFPSASVFELYGPTEGTIICTYRSASSNEFGRAEHCIGKPFKYDSVRLVDGYGRHVPIGAVGEIVIGGGSVARGYLNQPELTAEKFTIRSEQPSGREYRTGDLAKWLPDGSLAFLGRADNQVKIRGVRIELGEIESHCLEHPAVHTSVALVADEHGQQIWVYCGVDEQQAAEDLHDQLRQRLADALPAHMLPSHILLMDALPLSSNGKILRHALPAPQLRVEYQPLQGSAEKLVAQIWAKELNLNWQELGAKDDFFSLGGNSLLLIPIAEAFRNAGVEVSIRQLIEHQSVRSLASVLTQTSEKGNDLLVHLNSFKGENTLYMIHPGLGRADYYSAMAQHCNDTRVVGINPPYIENIGFSYQRLEKLANFYAELIITNDPSGRIMLGGYSSGGLIAYLVAHRLKELGRPVSYLCLLDSEISKTAQTDERLVIRTLLENIGIYLPEQWLSKRTSMARSDLMSELVDYIYSQPGYQSALRGMPADMFLNAMIFEIDFVLSSVTLDTLLDDCQIRYFLALHDHANQLKLDALKRTCGSQVKLAKLDCFHDGILAEGREVLIAKQIDQDVRALTPYSNTKPDCQVVV